VFCTSDVGLPGPPTVSWALRPVLKKATKKANSKTPSAVKLPRGLDLNKPLFIVNTGQNFYKNSKKATSASIFIFYDVAFNVVTAINTPNFKLYYILTKNIFKCLSECKI
jgi:hypothetical protein